MPAPAVYVIAIIGSFAVGVAFKHFVYDPHLSHKVRGWVDGMGEFMERGEVERRRRAQPMPATPQWTSTSRDNRRRSKASDSGDDDHDGDDSNDRKSIELEKLAAREVNEWRTEVNRTNSLRHRKNTSLGDAGPSMDESVPIISIRPLSPTNVIFDSYAHSSPMTTTTLSSRGDTPPAQVSPLRHTSSTLTLRSPAVNAESLPPPSDASNRSLSPVIPVTTSRSTSSIPSLSQTYPVDLDHEHGVELLSAPSSRAESPFYNVTHPLSPSLGSNLQSDSNYYSLSPSAGHSPLGRLASPRSGSDIDFLSDFGDEAMSSPSVASVTFEVVHDDHIDASREAAGPHFDLDNDDTGSEVSGSSWASAGARSTSDH